MTLNWNNIRSIHNSLNDGFEELVCQLAAKESIKEQRHFQRIGKPDGGKECFWQLNNEELYMWQAKYFTASLSPTQWTEIDISVKTAIDNHRKLVKYYVCVPLDMPDGKVKDRTSMLDKWKAKVSNWKTYATTKGISLEFEYWGSTELIARLSKRENEGLTYFWFNKDELSDEWLTFKNQESINALGARYTKELNFNLPIAKVFDGLSRDKNFVNQIHNVYKAFLEKYRGIHINIEHDEIRGGLVSLSESIHKIRKIYELFPFVGNSTIPLTDLDEVLKACSDTASTIDGMLYDLRSALEKEKSVKDYYSRPYSSEINEISSFISSIRDFNRFLNCPICKLANHPFLMITGKAGMGKSHLLADIVEKRKEKKQNSLLLLGENFTNQDMPWTQILQNQLRKIQLDEFIFLGALNAKAESERSRIIIFIDAINEGNGRKVWPKRLKSFIQSFKNYPWLGLAVSIRTSFEKLIAPDAEIGLNLIVRVNHEGFSGNEYGAVKRFFHHYGILQPTSPLLNPEFQNPLFLKLFCKSLSERGLHEIPAGYDGITSVLNYFLDSINLKLARADELDYDERKPLVKLVVEKILMKMVNNGKDHVPYLIVEEIVNGVFKDACGNTEPYLKRLISEGVLNDDMYWNENGKPVDVIYFAYQRFQDHLTVSLLLDKYLNVGRPELSFQSGQLHHLIKDSRTALSNQNLVEALAIQVPERTGRELFEVAPHTKLYYSVAEAFIQSLIWRKNETIGENSSNYVNDVIIKDEGLFNQFLEATILASMKPGFYFNAERLHSFLLRFSLAERDEIWTAWLQDKYDEGEGNLSAVKRLIDYAWNAAENEQEYIQDNAIILGCTTLGWFLTSANRYLRDAATKALVCLLQNHIHLIPQLLDKFKGVNDPYVIERLYGAGYGAVLRTNLHDSLVSASEYIYNEIFNRKEVYPHILLRDYARGIIEYTLYLKYIPQIDIIKVRPPYKSKSLPKKFPSNAAIDKKYKPKKDSGNYGKKNWGSTAILSSMTTEYGRGTAGYGDFGRYTFGSAFGDCAVDVNGLSNFAVQLIFELGYDPLKFSEFDSNQGSGRSSGHKERIGKKYQWIIFHELLARVSDQCQLVDESNWDRPRKAILYDGPWYPYVRDIDPTIVIKETQAERYADEYTKNWWFQELYSPWNQDNKDWITDRKNLPLPENILEVKDEEGKVWVWLEVHPEWGEVEPLGEDRWHTQRKRLWYQIRSYLVKQKDFSKLQKSFNRDFHRGELPEARRMYTVFDKEYYWSPAFNFFNKRYYSGENWIEVNDKSTEKSIAQVHRTTEYFNWEEEFDCSKTSAIQFYKPTQIIKEGLKLYISNKEGELVDDTGQKICFDPSVHNKSISGLLIKKDELLTWMNKEGLILVWSVVGEKQFLGNHRGNTDHPSRLNISGLYTFEDGSINGKLKFDKE